MNKFYVIGPAEGKMFGTKWVHAESLGPSNVGDSQKCPVCGGADRPAGFIAQWHPECRAGRWGAGWHPGDCKE